VPVGVGQLRGMRVAEFQQRMLKRMCDALAVFISIPAGNGKTTLMAAVGLERVCRGDEYVEVDVLATKEDQARRLVQTMIHMVECAPVLAERFDFFKDDGVLRYKPTGSWVRAHPTKLSAIQGLNSDLALIDEIGMVPPEIVTSMIARLGKKPGQRVVGFGTPGYSPDNMLEALRKMAHADELPPGVEFIEYAADAGCDMLDAEQQRKANPAIDAGFLDPESLPIKAALFAASGREHEFRAYHLGQPVETSGPWLPYGAWTDCMQQAAPPDGTQVVLGVWGNYRRLVSVCGCTLDGGIFFGWQADRPSDDQVADVVQRAADQWEVLEVVHKPHIRHTLVSALEDRGLPMVPWPLDAKVDVDSTAALYQAISEQTVAHDHDEHLAAQIALLTAKVDRYGNPRLVESSEVDVSAALAARAAWWRARCLAEDQAGAELRIYF